LAELMSEELLYQEEDTQKDKFLTFVIEDEFYGIEIKHVTEIIGLQAITKIPELPEYIKGIINLRGKIIPVMDVRIRFKKPAREYDDRTCIVVIDIGNISIGLIVDVVSEVLNIEEQNVVPPPEGSRGIGNRYIRGIGKVGSDVKLILDCDRLLNEEEIESLESI
jgi:purine-binding chemotaxis protein CheW